MMIYSNDQPPRAPWQKSNEQQQLSQRQHHWSRRLIRFFWHHKHSKSYGLSRLVRLLGMALLILGGISYGGYRFFDWLYPFPAARISEAQSGAATHILDAHGNLIAWRVDAEETWRFPVKLEAVSPKVIDATIAAEDKRFWTHSGVDAMAVCRAIQQNFRYGRRISGASTITMQTMRLLYPKARTWNAKITESFRALQLEECTDKPAILQAYLNCAPYGGNIIGIEAAAQHYFNKPASDLTLGEATLLAGIPQSPARFNPRSHLHAALKRRKFVLARMQTLGLAKKADCAAALREPIALSQPTPLRSAPHMATYLMSRTRAHGGIIQSTIDSDIQTIANDTARQYAAQLRNSGIDGVSVVIIDVATSSLVAMVGNPQPNHPQTGQVNGAIMLRQPGSLLKPFIYALAYERGMLTPEMTVYDTPTVWRGYVPENMDHAFRGPMSAADALRSSRNIPAVRLLDAIGTESLASLMQTLEMPVSGPAEKYGLSMALGTPEMRLIDVTNGYACLARMGQYAPLRLVASEPSSVPKRAFAPGAAWLTLRSLGAPESQAPSRAVWKTGTSWNYRDAWAVSVSPRYAVGVWCGAMSGNGHERLVGAQAALPLALEITAMLPHANDPSWTRPSTVSTRRVCAECGAPAGMHTAASRLGEFLPGYTRESPCMGHAEKAPSSICQKSNFSDAKGEASSSTQVSSLASSDKKTLTILSPKSDAIYLIPSPNSDSRHSSKTALHASTSALSGARSRLYDHNSNNDSGDDSAHNAGGSSSSPPITCQAEAQDGTTLYWFLDGSLLGVTQDRHTLTWMPIVGHHRMDIADSHGRSRHITFSVTTINTPPPSTER